MHQLKRLFSLFALTLALAGCAGQQLDVMSVFQRMQINSAYSKADKLLEKDMPVDAAKILWESSAGILPPHRQIMQIRAAEIMLDYSRPLNAYRYLIKIDEEPLAETDLLRKRIADARFYQITTQNPKILAALPDALIETGSQEMKINALDLTADAYAEIDSLTGIIKTRLLLNELLAKDRRAGNIAKLANSLLLSDPRKALQAQQEKPSDQVKAWLEFAIMATPETVDLIALIQQFETWQNQHQQWSIPESVRDELLSRWEYLDFTPEQIAVMLPLTGEYAKLGRVVEAGLLAQHNSSTPNFSIRFYNTDSDKDTWEIYRKAVFENGADMVIGPLLKSRVTDLASTSVQVPTIALNYVDKNPPKHSEFFQFGLLPEDEAVQIAEKMWEQGHRFVLALTPETDWGRRIYGSFERRYLKLGGIVRELKYYDPTFVDYATPLEDLFQLNESRQRHANLRRVLGADLQFIPRIRDDADAAVLFADSERAALIYPQMKYHYADKFPTYASSHVYRPNSSGKRNRDLDGLRYCDAPIVFEYDPAVFKDSEQEALLRLYALGADAYRLINRFRQLNIARTSFDGMTGELSIRSKQRFFRKLDWGNFSYGKPTPANQFN